MTIKITKYSRAKKTASTPSYSGGIGAATITPTTDIDIITEVDDTIETDKNVFSSLRTLFEIRKRILSNDSTSQLSNDNTFSSLRTVDEIDNAINEALVLVESMFLSKINNDTAQGLIRLLQGLKVGSGDKGITANGVATLLSVLANGIENDSFSAGPLGSGFALKKRDDGSSYFEVDEALFRKKATFIELIIQELAHVGGMVVLSSARMKCIKVEEYSSYYRCYFQSELDGRTINNQFAVGDFARYQTFNLKSGNRYYWRKVVSIGRDYIDLSKIDCDTGSTAPLAGDDICQLGNALDRNRQGALILSAVGGASLKMYDGINSYDLEGRLTADMTPSTGFKIAAESFKFTSGKTVQDMINDVSVGGRNLIRNSGDFTSTDYWGTIGMGTTSNIIVDKSLKIQIASTNGYYTWGHLCGKMITPRLELGEEYIYQMSVYTPITIECRLAFRDAAGNFYYEEWFTLIPGTHIITNKFICNTDIDLEPVFNPVYNNVSTSNYFIMNWAQLKKGNTISEWTPNDKDIDSKLLSAGIDIDKKTVTVTADKFKVQSQSGKEYAVFEEVSGVPTVKASAIDTNKLVAKNLATSKNGARVEIEGATMSVFGNSAKNIEFGVNDDGMAVMKYFDNDGRMLYDLGPDGINKLPVSLESWAEKNLKSCGANISEVFQLMAYKSIPLADGVTYYKFFSRITAGVVEKPNQHLRTFRTRSELSLYIPNGYYIKVSASPIRFTIGTMETGVRVYPEGIHPSNPPVYDRHPLYMDTITQYVNGLESGTLKVFWND